MNGLGAGMRCQIRKPTGLIDSIKYWYSVNWTLVSPFQLARLLVCLLGMRKCNAPINQLIVFNLFYFINKWTSSWERCSTEFTLNIKILIVNQINFLVFISHCRAPKPICRSVRRMLSARKSICTKRHGSNGNVAVPNRRTWNIRT